jgi:hypothetical protein
VRFCEKEGNEKDGEKGKTHFLARSFENVRFGKAIKKGSR